tara:strand:+ start:454 stop:1197 length:744 start_codon:yes stop_codon:yes gene_type:complete
MKIEEKIKNKYLYSKKTNIFKFFYFYFQFLKAKFKPRLAYSHWGIDLIITKLLNSKNKGIYIDVGCHHPFLNNHSYLLYKSGWEGINIDIDYNSIDMFNFFRKSDVNIQTAVTDHKGEVDLFFYHNRAAKNTISKEFGSDAKEQKKINSDTLNNIIENSKFKNSKIDFVSIDVEGNEMNVLNGFNLKKYKPKLILLEFILPNKKEFYEKDINEITNSEVYNFLIKNEYKLINWNHDDLLFMRLDYSK